MWFKVDDKLHSHPKRYAAGPRAMGLWVIAGSWAADQLTDGVIPHHMVAALGFTGRDATALVAAGLWLTDPEGWRFHDWHQMNPSRSEVMAKRNAETERKRKWRERAQRDAATGQFASPSLKAVPNA